MEERVNNLLKSKTEMILADQMSLVIVKGSGYLVKIIEKDAGKN